MQQVLTAQRFFATVYLLFHLMVVGAGPLADARLGAPDLSHAPVHVEDQSEPPCESGHEHLFCQVCRVLHSFDLPVDGSTGLRVALFATPAGLPSPAHAAPSTPAASPRLPRAPPLA